MREREEMVKGEWVHTCRMGELLVGKDHLKIIRNKYCIKALQLKHM